MQLDKEREMNRMEILPSVLETFSILTVGEFVGDDRGDVEIAALHDVEDGPNVSSGV